MNARAMTVRVAIVRPTKNGDILNTGRIGVHCKKFIMIRKVGEVGMRLTDEMIKEDDKRFKRQNLLAEFNYCGKEVPKRKSITNDDIRFYAWLCRSAYTLLKEQQKRIEEITQLRRSYGKFY